MAIVHVTSENYEKEVLQSDKPVLIDFWASWCGPCQMLGPVIEEVSEEVTDVKFVKVVPKKHRNWQKNFLLCTFRHWYSWKMERL